MAACLTSNTVAPSPLQGEGEKGIRTVLDGEGDKGICSVLDGEGEKGIRTVLDGEGEERLRAAIKRASMIGDAVPLDGEGEERIPSPLAGEGGGYRAPGSGEQIHARKPNPESRVAANAHRRASIRMARKSLTLVRVGPVSTRSPSAWKKP